MSSSSWSAILLAAVLLAPTATVDAAPRGDSARSRPSDGSRTRKRKRRTAKRSIRRGLKVLNSRETSGRTSKGSEPPADIAAIKLIDPAVMMALAAAMPAEHVELGAAKLADGNVTAGIPSGTVNASPAYGPLGLIKSSEVWFSYPMVGAAARDLVLECTGEFESDVRIVTAAYSAGWVFNVWDSLEVSASKAKPRTKIKVLIDTSHPVEGQPYFIDLHSDDPMTIYKCSLDLMD